MGLHRQLILGTAPLLFFLCDKALHIKKHLRRSPPAEAFYQSFFQEQSVSCL